jgi:hypothetical protein
MHRDKNLHLYLLIGQSNMAGRGEVEAQDKESHPRVFTLDKESKWVPAVDPIHFDKPVAGVGPGLTFGKTMADHDLSIRIGLIPCAAGGSPISVWKHGAYWKQTNSEPYDNAVERTRIAMEHGILKGILWHQGESDSNENDAQLYGDRLAALINTLRTDLGAPKVPFIAATLGDFVHPSPVTHHPSPVTHYPSQIVNEAIRHIPQRVEYTACVESTGLGHKGDNMHFSSASARELGRRYAEAMIRLQHGKSA